MKFKIITIEPSKQELQKITIILFTIPICIIITLATLNINPETTKIHIAISLISLILGMFTGFASVLTEEE